MYNKFLLKPLAAALVLGATATAVKAQTTDTGQVEEVVVTALGIKKQQRALGYAVQGVSGRELQGSGEQNVVQSISSKVAGALVTGSGGTPGSSSKILLRGAATFTGSNQPLFVVDGVPIDNSTSQSSPGDYPFNANLQGVNNSNRAIDINPDDIESISVLKGPSGAALYGVRGANGVIIITTKRGGANGKRFSAEFGSTFDWSSVNKLPEKQMTYGQGIGGGRFDADGNVQAEGAVNKNIPYAWGPMIPAGEAYDNPGTFFQTALSNTNNLGITVNGDNTSARFSVGNTQQSGIVPNTNFHRTTVRVNTDSRVTDKLTVGSSINLINSGGTRAQNGSNLSGTMLSLMRMPADFNILGGTGEGKDGLAYKNADGSGHTYYTYYDNPYWTVYENPFTDDVNRILGNINTNYQVNDWLTANWRVGTDQYTDSRKQIFAVGSWQPDNAPGGEVNENVIRYREWYSDLVLTAKKQINADLDATITAGNNLNHRYSSSQFLRGRDLAIPNFYNLSNASNLYSDGGYSEVRTAAMFGGVELNYSNFLYVNFTGRNEWASTFGSAKNNFFYPSVNTSLVFTELMGRSDVLSFGKLRLAYAEAGINPGPYGTQTYYGQPSFTDGFTSGIGFPYLGMNGFGMSNGLGNNALAPERVTGKEVGVDLRFFSGKLNVDLTVYNQKSSDILISMPIASSSGFGGVVKNSGEMVNKGIELLVNGTIIKNDNFSWDMGINWSRNRSEVLALAPGVDEINIEAAFSSAGSYAIVGEPYGALYGARWARDEAGNLLIDDDGTPFADSKRGNIGNPFPDWFGGLRNTFNIKGVSLTMLWDFRQGGDIWCGTYARMNNYGMTEASADRGRTYLIEGVRVSDGARNTTEVDAETYWRYFKGDAGGPAENAVYDGSWKRLRELGLNYKLPVTINGINSITLGAVGRNLLLFTDYPGVDPETSLTGAGSNIGGFDYFNNPGAKSFMFSVKLGF